MLARGQDRGIIMGNMAIEDEGAFIRMGQFESDPERLTRTLAELRELQSDHPLVTDEEMVERLRQASSVVIDFFERLSGYAEFEDHPELTGLGDASISKRIIRSVSGYPDFVSTNIGLEALLTEAYREREEWKEKFWKLALKTGQGEEQ